LTEFWTGALILVGACFALVGAIGLVRFPDFYSRAHAPTKAVTLGASSVVLGSLAFFFGRGETTAVKELLIVAFLFLTAPAGAHMLAKAAAQLKVPFARGTRGAWEAEHDDPPGP